MEGNSGLGGGLGNDAIYFRNSIDITAPIDLVFQVWSCYRNFPRFMPIVLDVREVGTGRPHRKASGPMGSTIEWDALVTEFDPNQLIGWGSEPGSPMEQAGSVYFQPNADGSTHVDVAVFYARPEWQIAYSMAMLFGTNTESEMEERLRGMKEYIEKGQPPSGYRKDDGYQPPDHAPSWLISLERFAKLQKRS